MKENLEINGVRLHWDTEEGLFQYEGADVVLFWINSAFKVFLDTIEEVSGDDSAKLVLETAGYRTGQIVAGYYRDMGDPSVILKTLPNIYGAAGWGKMSILHYSSQEKNATVRIENSWEYKASLAQNKTTPGSFLPGHWAGVFSGVFGEQMWYRITKSQILGDPHDELELYASTVTPEQNVHDLIRFKEKQQIVALEQKVAERTRELDELIQDLSAPVIPVLDKIIVIPMISRYDHKRSQDLLQKALYGLKEYQAEYLLLDLTGLTQVSEETIDLLHKLVRSVSLLGGTCILVGVSPAVSTHIVEAHYDTKGIISFSTLRHGIYYALAQENLQILKKS